MQTYLLPIPALSSNLFTVADKNQELALKHVPHLKRLIAEISQIRGFRRIYNDAADIGIRIRSEKTGVVTTWYVDGEVSHDGEIVSWFLKPTTETLRKNPQLYDWIVDIVND